MIMRLDRLLKESGFGSRKECRQLVKSRRVFVNETQVRDESMHIRVNEDQVTVDGNTITYQQHVYIMLNKPQGVISATLDAQQQTVLDLIPEYKHRSLFPYGRLDIDTEGLLIIGDDGILAHRLLSPKHHVEKEYYVVVDKAIPPHLSKAFLKGVTLEDDYVCQPAILKLEGENKAKVILSEGKFHQVKRMFQAHGLEVVYLQRIRFHTILLDSSLKLGEYRLLNSDEIARLKDENPL